MAIAPVGGREASSIEPGEEKVAGFIYSAI
jgi:hypothetical protein